MRRTGMAAALLAAGAIGGGAAVAGWELTDADAETTARPAASADIGTATLAATGGSGLSVAEIYRRTSAGVVQVRATTSASGFAPGGEATGSGFVIDGEGRVITNEHVVGGADSVTVVLPGGEERAAEVVGTDRSTDIALLDVTDDDGLTPLTLGATSSLAVGDPVVAIGSPFGLQGTLTAGVVSGLDRQIEAPDGFTIDGVIQTDAALNSGNSGGPLLDGRGRVVGVNSQIESRTGGNVGIGYAVPVEVVRSVVSQLVEDGSVEHGYLGVQLSEPDGEAGVQLAQVVDGGPADEAGLRGGDRILSAAGEPVDSVTEVRGAVAERRPGAKLELRISRDGDEQTVVVELGERPDNVE